VGGTETENNTESYVNAGREEENKYNLETEKPKDEKNNKYRTIISVVSSAVTKHK
jgi:hypothetical protein